MSQISVGTMVMRSVSSAMTMKSLKVCRQFAQHSTVTLVGNLQVPSRVV